MLYSWLSMGFSLIAFGMLAFGLVLLLIGSLAWISNYFCKSPRKR